MNHLEHSKVKKAILNNNVHYKGVILPTRQTGGTDAQIIAYAGLQATKFLTINN